MKKAMLFPLDPQDAVGYLARRRAHESTAASRLGVAEGRGNMSDEAQEANPETAAEPEPPRSETPASELAPKVPAEPAGSLLDGSVLERLPKALFALTMLVSILVIVLEVLARFDVRTLWDDAYIFQRYTYNVTHHGRIAWNPSGPATYGLTSLSFLLVTIPLQWLTKGNISLAAMLSSMVPGVLVILLAAWMAFRSADDSRRMRLVTVGITTAYLAISAFSDHCVSGMDTTWGLAFAIGYLLLVHGLSNRDGNTTKQSILIGVYGGLALATRPEFLSLAFLAPTFMVAFPHRPEERRNGIRMLAATAGVVAAHLALCRFYFGSALPLPLYAKATNLYGAGIARAYSLGSSVDLLSWLGYSWPLILVPAAAISSGVRAFFRQSSSLDKAAVSTSLVLIAYAWFFVTPIMGHSQRFYYPAVPTLLYATCRSIVWLSKASNRPASDRSTGFSLAHLAGIVAAAHAMNVMFPIVQTTGKDLIGLINRGGYGYLDVNRHSTESGPQKYWFRMDKFAELPNDLVIATTEVGMISVLKSNLEKTIIDLAGLNDPRFSLQRFSAKTFFDAYDPDLIYMPHPHYTSMIDDIRGNPEFAGYEVFNKAQLGTLEFGIAIRKDSKHIDRMRAIVSSGMQQSSGSRGVK